jgi:NADH dehydrogenase
MTAPRSEKRAVLENRDDTGLDVVTGAFGYSGRAIARELQERDRHVRTLTGHPGRAEAGSTIEPRALDFEDLPGLTESLRGATTLYNTYWVRFARGRIDHNVAVENSRALFNAARRAGVQRIVHVSITNPSIDSPYPYFRGKALVERALAETGLPYTVLRPAILFGADGVLINNIAWLLRHFPVFAVGGRGDYRVRAIHVDDLANLAMTAGACREDSVVDAVGPDRPTFLELVETIRAAVGSRAEVIQAPGILLPVAATFLNVALRDVLLTWDEYRAMADNLADSAGTTTGTTSIKHWIADNGPSLGITYANELERHFRS